MQIIEKAYAKINLGLDITGKRPDGYHDIRTVMQTISLCDEVHVIKKDTPGVTMEVNVPGLSTDESNLCIRAARIFEEHIGLSNGYHIKLTKNIPMEAGLAGGSADAAAVLRALCKLENHPMGEELLSYAVKLGADVPFCLYGGCALAQGIGEILTPIQPGLCDVFLLVVKPNCGVSTKEAYAALDQEKRAIFPQIDAIVQALQSESKQLIQSDLLEDANVFASYVMRVHPQVSEWEKRLQKFSAKRVFMSGSGPTLIAIFTDKHEAELVMEQCRSRYPNVCCELAVPIKQEDII